MRKIVLTALAVMPLFSGVALADSYWWQEPGRSHAGDGQPTQNGPEAYSPAQIAQAWRQYRQGVYGPMMQYQPNAASQHTAPTNQTD